MAVAIIYRHRKKETMGAGLILAYCLNLWLIHWLAAVIYFFPWYHNFDPEDVAAGFKLSTYAITAFGAGSLFVTPLLRKIVGFPPPMASPRKPEAKLSTWFIVIGLLCYLVLMPLLGGVPTLTALISVGWNFLIVGLILKCWAAWRERKKKKFLGWLMIALCLPFMTVVTQGFIGYGTVALIAVLAFVADFYRPRWRVLAIGILAFYLGISLFVTYMRDRNAIREVVWGGQSYGSRFDRMYMTFSEFEFFDPYDQQHLWRIDERLNQSALVGASMRHLETGSVEYANGETLWMAVLSVIPRAVWPDKPIAAGSGELVSRYTGISFIEGTSVGIGQVMEFYINFGVTGVICGFMILGIIVATVDRVAGERLAEGNWHGFAFWFASGLSFLQVGGQLVEVTAGAAAAMLLAVLIKHFYLLPMRNRRLESVFKPLRKQASLARLNDNVKT